MSTLRCLHSSHLGMAVLVSSLAMPLRAEAVAELLSGVRDRLRSDPERAGSGEGEALGDMRDDNMPTHSYVATCQGEEKVMQGVGCWILFPRRRGGLLRDGR